MKHLALFSSLLGVFCLAAPATGWSRDRGHHHHHGGSRHYSGSHHGHHGSHYSHRSSYCGPSISYRSYRPYYYSSFYPSYGYGYSPYSYYSSGPSIGLSYTSYRASRSVDYDDDLAVDVQRALARRGYYRGAIDGDVGPGTRGAIRDYQYRNRLEVTGRIDRSLLRSLGLS